MCVKVAGRLIGQDGLVRLVPGLGTRAVDGLMDDYPVLVAPGQPGLRVNATPDEIIRYSPRRIDVINLDTRRFDTLEVRDLLREVGGAYPALRQVVSVIGEESYLLHKQTGVVMDRIRAEAFDQIAAAIRTGNGATNYDVQQYMMRRFAEEGLTTYSPPMVGVNDHPADPHFDVTADNARPYKP